MRDYQGDLDTLGDALTWLLGMVSMHDYCFSKSELLDIRLTITKAMKARTRIEELLAKEFDGVTVTGAADDGD
jgi:hypothetical protein